MFMFGDARSDHDVFIRHKGKPRCYDSCSQPFGKPRFSLKHEGIINVLRNTPYLLSRSQKNVDLTLGQSKRLLKRLAKEMNRISKPKVPCLLNSMSEDYWSLLECRSFILKWADELKGISTSEERQSSSKRQTPMSRRQCEDQMASTQVTELQEAHTVLSRWAASLKSVTADSVCPAEDVRCVLEDLGRQWKRGHLANMLPAMEVIMRSVLQEEHLKTCRTHPMSITSRLSRLTMVH